MNTIRMIQVPLPPLEEQKEIVKLLKQKIILIESYQKQINELHEKQDIFINNLNHIQSSVLDSAFSGKLVQ